MLVVIIKSLPNVLAVPHAGQAAYRTSSRQGPVHGESHMLVLLCDPDHLRDRYGGSHSIGSVPLGTSSIAHIVDAMVVHKVMLASTVRISSSILDSPRKLIVTQMIVERYRNIVCHDLQERPGVSRVFLEDQVEDVLVLAQRRVPVASH